jgi:hypothetical protein
MPEPSREPTLTYTRVRLRWCLSALLALLRRWGIYLIVGVLVLGSSGNGAIAAMAGMTGWSVLPLMRASREPVWWMPLIAAAHSLAGAVVMWGLRPVLWSRSWAEAENALPIDPREQRRSDVLVATLGLMPLFGAYVAGAFVWVGKSPPWMQGGWMLAFFGLALSMLMSACWGALILRSMRRSPRMSAARRVRKTVIKAPLESLSAITALVVLPLLRGPANRAGRLLVAGTLALLLVDAALARWTGLAAWWLAGFAALAFALTTRLNGVLTADLAPVHLACTPLPLSMQMLLRTRRTTALLPQLVGQAVLLAALVPSRHAVRPAVLAAYMLAAVAGAAHQVIATTSIDGPREQDPANRVSAWLFILVLLVALASEVIRND